MSKWSTIIRQLWNSKSQSATTCKQTVNSWSSHSVSEPYLFIQTVYLSGCQSLLEASLSYPTLPLTISSNIPPCQSTAPFHHQYTTQCLCSQPSAVHSFVSARVCVPPAARTVSTHILPQRGGQPDREVALTPIDHTSFSLPLTDRLFSFFLQTNHTLRCAKARPWSWPLCFRQQHLSVKVKVLKQS